MIPKVIHYCWFGRGEYSPLMKKCLRSWKKYCPDYEIIEWNEDNFDVNSTIWTKQAYECKKWAFVSDYVRLWVLYNYGGVYMDTDVELIKQLDDLLENEAFTGFESHDMIQTGVIAAKKNNSMIKEWLDWYKERPYILEGKQHHEPNVKMVTESLLKHGLLLDNTYQEIGDMVIYPQTYFCPINVDKVTNCKSRDTYAIHHFNSSWRKGSEMTKFKKAKRAQVVEKIKTFPQRTVRKIVGDDTVEKLKKRVNKK